MTEQELDSTIHRITTRHIARCLSHLESVNVPSLVKDTVKRELWYLSNDLKEQVMQEQGDNHARNDEEERH